MQTEKRERWRATHLLTPDKKDLARFVLGQIRHGRDVRSRRSRPWWGAMEATLFTGWVYDHLKPWAQELKVAHPAMLKAIAASKKKNDKVDARKIADPLRCDLLPECYMAPSATRELRRVLRHRNLVVRQATRMKNRIAGLLMETGTAYNKERLHGKTYFSELLGSVREIPASVINLLKLSRGQLEFFQGIQQRLVKGLRGMRDSGNVWNDCRASGAWARWSP